MGIYFRFFILHLRWKIQNGQLKKSDKNDNAYPGPLAQLLVKLLLTANVGVRRSIMRIAYTKTIFCLTIW